MSTCEEIEYFITALFSLFEDTGTFEDLAKHPKAKQAMFFTSVVTIIPRTVVPAIQIKLRTAMEI